MGTHAAPAGGEVQYWGYLIKPDKRPSPIFEQLLLSIAKYINKHITPWDTTCLTPTKLSHFYRLVGGDYDTLFLETPSTSLSFIYQSLGCYHTLQPSPDPHAAPSIPALTPQGFARWQTIQLLLDPEQHVPLLREAVKRFALKNPHDGQGFPDHLPCEALPSSPDKDMVAWHNKVSQRLKHEASVAQTSPLPPRPPIANVTTNRGRSQPSSPDFVRIRPASLVDAALYFQHPRTYYHPNKPGNPMNAAGASRRVSGPPQGPPDARRHPLLNKRNHSFPSPAGAGRSGLSSIQSDAGLRPQYHNHNHRHHHHHHHNNPTQGHIPPYTQSSARWHARAGSVSSVSSDTSTTSSVSTASSEGITIPPVRQQQYLAAPPPGQTSVPGSPLYRPVNHSEIPTLSEHRRSAGSNAMPAPNARGLNVRWDDDQSPAWAPGANMASLLNQSRPSVETTAKVPVARARSVGSRPLLGKYAGREAEDRGRMPQTSPGRTRKD